MPLPPDRRTRDALVLLDLFLTGNGTDRWQRHERRKLREVRDILTGRETLRSVGERARLENRRRANRLSSLLRFLPGSLRQRVVGRLT